MSLLFDSIPGRKGCYAWRRWRFSSAHEWCVTGAWQRWRARRREFGTGGGAGGSNEHPLPRGVSQQAGARSTPEASAAATSAPRPQYRHLVLFEGGSRRTALVNRTRMLVPCRSHYQLQGGAVVGW